MLLSSFPFQTAIVLNWFFFCLSCACVCLCSLDRVFFHKCLKKCDFDLSFGFSSFSVYIPKQIEPDDTVSNMSHPYAKLLYV